MDTRETILQIACQLYLDGGLANLSMRRVAKAAGISATAIYRHYEHKEALLISMIDEGYRIFGGYLYQSLGKPNPLQRLMACGEAYRQFGLEHRAYYQLLFVAPELYGKRDLPEQVRERAAGTLQILRDRVSEVLPNPKNVEACTKAIWAMSHGLVSLYHAGMLGSEAELTTQWTTSHANLLKSFMTPTPRTL